MKNGDLRCPVNEGDVGVISRVCEEAVDVVGCVRSSSDCVWEEVSNATSRPYNAVNMLGFHILKQGCQDELDVTWFGYGPLAKGDINDFSMMIKEGLKFSVESRMFLGNNRAYEFNQRTDRTRGFKAKSGIHNLDTVFPTLHRVKLGLDTE